MTHFEKLLFCSGGNIEGKKPNKSCLKIKKGIKKSLTVASTTFS